MADRSAFTWSKSNKKFVQSEAGFEVGCIAQDEFEYREEGRTMRLEGEFLVGELDDRTFGFAFYPSWRHTRWQDPHATDEISAADRMRIRSNIMEAFDFMNAKAVFE